jgi:hypothetical protein
MVMEKKRMKPQDVNQVYHSNHPIYIILAFILSVLYFLAL